MFSRNSLGFAFVSILAAGCSSTTSGFYGDGGTDGATKSDTGGLKFDAGPKTDSGTKFDSGVAFDSGTTTKDTGTSTMTCESCQATYCSSEASACSAEKACTDTLDCISACTDDTCANNCLTTYGSTRFMPWYNCLYDNCQDTCFEP